MQMRKVLATMLSLHAVATLVGVSAVFAAETRSKDGPRQECQLRAAKRLEAEIRRESTPSPTTAPAARGSRSAR